MVFSMSILQTTELKKYYGAEPNITRALDGVTLSIAVSYTHLDVYKRQIPSISDLGYIFVSCFVNTITVI